MLAVNPGAGGFDYECIDPSLGEHLWRLDDPTTAADLQTRLQRHLRHCSVCRQRVALSRTVAEGLQDGRLVIRPMQADRRVWSEWSLNLGVGVLAACLALVFVLPPRLPGLDLVMRGGNGPFIAAPLPGSVVLDRTPVIRWTRIERASSYRVSLREVGGDFQWSGETTSPEVSLPASARLPVSARFRVGVEPVPAHLVADGALQTSFRTGTWREFAAFRLGAAPPAILIGALAGALALMVGAMGWLRTRT